MTIDEIVDTARDAYENRGLDAGGEGDTLWLVIETELREGCQGYAQDLLIERAVELMRAVELDVLAVRQALEREL